MKSRANTVSFVLFVAVVLGTLFWLLEQHGRTNWGMVSVLTGVLLLRAALFVVNLRQQKRNVQRGHGPVRIETRLGLTDDPEGLSVLPHKSHKHGHSHTHSQSQTQTQQQSVLAPKDQPAGQADDAQEPPLP